MRRLRGLGLLALLALGVGLLPTPVADAADCEVKFGKDSAAATCQGRLGWSYDAADGTFDYGTVIASSTSDDPYEYSEQWACSANTPARGTNAGCAGAFNCPTRLDPEGQQMQAIRIVAFRRLKDDPNDAWRPTNSGVCKYTGKSTPMSAVVDAAREDIEKKVGRPKINAQPPGGVTLVNFTSLFHAPERTITSLKITKPVAGVITATPQYTWDLGDGITAEGSGHPYDQGTDPRSPASDDYYVKAVYSSPGLKQVRLTLTWQASITLNGSGAIPLEPIVFTADTTTTAKTATARLYAR